MAAMLFLATLLLVLGAQPGKAADLSDREERFLNLFGATTTANAVNTTTAKPFNPIDAIGSLLFGTTTKATTTTTLPATTTTVDPLSVIGGLLFGTTTKATTTTTLPATTTAVDPLSVIGGLLFGTTTKATTTTTTLPATTTTVDPLSVIGGLLFGTTTTTTTTTTAPATTTTAAPGPLSLLVGLLQGLLKPSTTAASNSTTAANSTGVSTNNSTTSPPLDLVNTLLGVLQGNVTALSTTQIGQLATLLGLSPKPIPNPMVDPLGFITNPLITPIVLAALTGNVPGLLMAMGGLAGNIMLQQLLAPPATTG